MEALEVVRTYCEASAGTDVVPQLRESLDRWDRADTAERERMIQDTEARWLASDVEVRVHGGLVASSGRGWDAVMRLFADWYALWESYSFDIAEYRDLGGGAILTTTKVRGLGRGGIPVDMTVFAMYRVKDEKIVSWEIFGSEQAALRSVQG